MTNEKPPMRTTLVVLIDVSRFAPSIFIFTRKANGETAEVFVEMYMYGTHNNSHTISVDGP